MPQFNLGQKWANIGKTVGDIAQMQKSSAERKRAERFQGQQMLQNTLKDVTGYFTGLEKEKTRQRERQEDIDREQEQFEWEKHRDARDFADKQWQRKVEQGEANLDRYIAERNRKEVMELENRKLELLEQESETAEKEWQKQQEIFDLEKRLLELQLQEAELEPDRKAGIAQARNRAGVYETVRGMSNGKYAAEDVDQIAANMREHFYGLDLFGSPEEAKTWVDNIPIEKMLLGSIEKPEEVEVDYEGFQSAQKSIDASIALKMEQGVYDIVDEGNNWAGYDEEAITRDKRAMLSAYQDAPFFESLMAFYSTPTSLGKVPTPVATAEEQPPGYMLLTENIPDPNVDPNVPVNQEQSADDDANLAPAPIPEDYEGWSYDPKNPIRPLPEMFDNQQDYQNAKKTYNLLGNIVQRAAKNFTQVPSWQSYGYGRK